MPQQDVLDNTEREIAVLIVDKLALDVDPDSIAPDAPLFVEGLGLDSIDALEIAFLITQQYGVEIKQGDERNRETFSSLRALSRFVSEHRAN
jgi:acyl carrier protein